jgi:DNA/RNA-binding domain of Phe-tRNA-synthetase-like protein
MFFQHSPDIWAAHPSLVAGVVVAAGIVPDAGVDAQVDRCYARAATRLATTSVAEHPEIQAWRRAFARMGLKPTQYRCAAESLLRRFAKEQALPRIHPLVDLCNAMSLAYSIPVAALDVGKITESLEVRYADGDESYQAFSGEIQQPAAGEVIFADAARRAHSRRWTNRQSGDSAVRDSTGTVLIVAEALHDTAFIDVQELTSELAGALADIWPVAPKTAMLSRAAPRFEF